MILKEFQKKAIRNLIESFLNTSKKEVVLKSATGSGKTIILTHFIDEYIKENVNTVFLWFTPGKGNLEEQSKEKMDRYVHNSSTKLLYEIMNVGFKENDVCFINWELITKKGNNALKEGEKENFYELIKKAQNDGLEFIVIVDEEHVNDTVKADEIISYTNAIKIIRASATPKNYVNPIMIDIDEDDVIEEGLIKKQIIINQDFEDGISVDSQVNYLMEKALAKQRELKKQFIELDVDVNPLIIIQVPNKSDFLITEVERYLEEKQITYDNQLLAIWLSDRKENLEELEKNNSKPIALIIKQAVATGWDCPRAHILVKLRDNMSEVFEIQTIGRIRRMPQAKHYGIDQLDSAYIYTLDEKFIENVKLTSGRLALDAKKIFLKKEHYSFTATKELKSDLSAILDVRIGLRNISKYLKGKYNLNTKLKDNILLMEKKGYVFYEDIIKSTASGTIKKLTKDEFETLRSVGMTEKLSTHIHGREYHQVVASIASKISMDYSTLNQIIRRLFDRNYRDDGNKILSLTPRLVYSFVINNKELLNNDLREALSSVLIYHDSVLKLEGVKEEKFSIPKETIFTYNSKSKVQREYYKNVYKNYLSSAEIRSDGEKEFEKFCENNNNVLWWYKNGDKGLEYLSIVYIDNSGKQKSFYPDYVLQKTNGEIMIIETKGGFSRTGESEDIDIFSPIKFELLIKYLEKNNLKGGFVRKDKGSNELFICQNNYSPDIQSESWQLLEDIIDD